MKKKNAAELINSNSGETDYWTPPEIIEAARTCLRGIELDPATSEAANKIVKAERIFTSPPSEVVGTLKGSHAVNMGGQLLTIDDELPLVGQKGRGALGEKWNARSVWMNHPFSGGERRCLRGCMKAACRKRGFHIATDIPSNADWINYLNTEHLEQRTKSAICITFAATSEKWFKPLLGRPQCFLTPRTNYFTPDGKIMPGVTKGSVVTYFGRDVGRFASCFNKLGVVKVAM